MVDHKARYHQYRSSLFFYSAVSCLNDREFTREGTVTHTSVTMLVKKSPLTDPVVYTRLLVYCNSISKGSREKLCGLWTRTVSTVIQFKDAHFLLDRVVSLSNSTSNIFVAACNSVQEIVKMP